MPKRPTAYCDRCESTVYADDVHSCFDAKLVRTVAEAERKVIEWAEVYVGSLDMCDDHGYDEFVSAVRRLREVRGA